jgi:SpoU rRNA methylase family enzyme
MVEVSVGSRGTSIGMSISPAGMGGLIFVGILIGVGIMYLIFKKKLTGAACPKCESVTRMGLEYNTTNDLVLTIFQDIQSLIDLVKPYGCAQVESMKVEISNSIDQLDDRVCTGLTKTLDELAKEVSKKEGYKSAESAESVAMMAGSFGPQMIGFDLIPRELMNTALPMMTNIINKLNPQICPGGKLNKAVLKKLYIDMLDSICG